MAAHSFRSANFAVISDVIPLQNLVYDFVRPVGAYDGFM